jgi:folate-dependent phosphoribosylglycinamide formyltransferase PurN
MQKIGAMTSKNIVLLGRRDRPTAILYNSLCAEGLAPVAVIVEDAESRWNFLRRRIRREGFMKVIGQVAFRATVVPWLKITSRKRVKSLMTEAGLEDAAIPKKALRHVASVNSGECVAALNESKPAVVVVSGTRIISNRVLGAIPATFINMHTGITPKYRGSHGGYWALVQGDREACGVTVHAIDAGIDTGPILAQSTVRLNGKDNFVTYSLVQQAAGLPLLRQAIRDVQKGEAKRLKPASGDSKLWTHPTLIEYIRNRIKLGVK